MRARKRNWVFAWIALGLLGFLAGCGTKQEMQKVSIMTLPPEAVVTLDGASGNVTPTEVMIPLDGKDHYIFITKEGCDEVRKVLTHDQYPEKLEVHLNCR